MNADKMDELMHLTQTVRRLEASAKKTPSANNMRVLMDATVALNSFNLKNKNV